METTAPLTSRAELLRQIDYISEDDALMGRLRRYVAKLAEKRAEQAAAQARLEESLRQALREVRLEREGKLKMQTWEEVKDELRAEGYFD